MSAWELHDICDGSSTKSVDRYNIERKPPTARQLFRKLERNFPRQIVVIVLGF